MDREINVIKSFADIKMLGTEGAPLRIAVAEAQDAHTLEAVFHAADGGNIRPVLYGPADTVKEIWKKVSGGASVPEIVDTKTKEESLALVMDAVRTGMADCVMKGGLETGALMKAVLNSKTGIKKNHALSLVAMMESPYYHKVFAVTDVGLMMYPNLEQKKAILENAVEVFHKLGVSQPKAAVLAAVEKINPEMPETVDADALKKMCEEGRLNNCFVEGPISYDLCMDREAAAIKGYESAVAGDPDILVVPDIAAGNLLSKSLTCTGGAKTCGTVVGAMVPIILTSRSAPAEDKYMSIMLAAALSRKEER